MRKHQPIPVVKTRLLALLLAVGLLLDFLVTESPVSAHMASYGYAKWHISHNRLEWTMVIDEKSIMELGPVDLNHDGALSEEEATTAYPSIISPYITDKLTVSVNGSPQLYEFDSLSIVNGNELQLTFHLESKWTVETVKVDYRLFYENSAGQHKNISLFYLPGHENMPMEQIFQSSSPSWEAKVTDPPSGWIHLGRFILLGIEHILTGYDHILFLASLVIIGLKLRQTLTVVTAFTIAHSITLILAVLEVVQLSSRLVEVAIALTICYVAAENIVRRDARHRTLLTFLFGLIHGFGFANVLQKMTIPRSSLVASLFGFNVGVEFGQILVLCILLPILYGLQKVPRYRQIAVGVSAVIFLLGFIWFLEREFQISILNL